MNPGGEPERDDTGLPPVDIEIPDDARELDRDVQAYYREQRAHRRQRRRSRLNGFLGRDGIVLPLLACCLILALITGTLLTVFTAASDQGFPSLPGAGGQPGSTGAARTGAANGGHASSGPASTGSATSGPARAGSARAGSAGPAGNLRAAGPPRGIRLPAATLQVGGRLVRLGSLTRAMLLLVPPNCRCAAAVTALARLAATSKATAYLVTPAGGVAGASALAGQVNRQSPATISVAVDSGGALRRYQHGLTAILIGPHHAAVTASQLGSDGNFTHLRSRLTS